MLNYFGHGGCICDEGLSSNNAHVLEISADVKEAQLVLKLIRIHAAPPPPPHHQDGLPQSQPKRSFTRYATMWWLTAKLYVMLRHYKELQASMKGDRDRGVRDSFVPAV